MAEKRITRIPATPSPPKRTRTVAYARVSSGKDAMLHSLSVQVSHYSALIQNNPEWEYVGVYADEALTGTKDDRPQLQKLLADCRAGLIDQVLVKSVSRLARNTVTLLEIVREFRLLGVDIFFEREGIHTMSAEGELMLTLIASIAQEESLSTSENCKWRIRSEYKQGNGKIRLPIFGYKWSDGEYRIVPDEAVVVRRIFDQYEAGASVGEILAGLRADGCPAPREGLWSDFAVRYILRNERYIGDTLLQKEYTADYLTKKRRPNKGELPQYYVTNTHDAIVAREQYERVQAIIAKRAARFAADRPGERKYPFSGILLCAKCGKPYMRKVAHGRASWNCGTFIRKGKAYCHGKQIPEAELLRLTAEVLGVDSADEDMIRDRVEHILVPAPNKLEFVLKDGRTEERDWRDRSRSDSWDADARSEQSIRMKGRHAK